MDPPRFFVGYADDENGVSRACRFHPFGAFNSGVLITRIGGNEFGTGRALGVNRNGECVGRIVQRRRSFAFHQARPTIAQPNPRPVDLNPRRLRGSAIDLAHPERVALYVSEARDINERGEIVALGIAGGKPAGFVLIPS